MNTQISKKLTLEDLLQHKAKVTKELSEQKKTLTASAHKIFAPALPVANSTHSLMHSFNRGMAIFEGVMVGVKTINRIRSFFGRSKKKKRR